MPGTKDAATKASQKSSRATLHSAVQTRGYATVNDFQLALRREAKVLGASRKGADQDMARKYGQAAAGIREVWCDVFGCACDCE